MSFAVLAPQRVRVAPFIKALCIVGTVLAFYLLLSDSALAADAASDFDELYMRVTAWAGGSLGKSIAIIFLLVGLAMGVIRGSISGAVTCIAAAMALVVAPSVVSSIFGNGI